MNKVKMFFIAAALVLTTAGVFAGKAKSLFATYTLQAYRGGSYTPLSTVSGFSPDITNVSLTTSASSTPISFSSSVNNLTYSIYALSGTTYYKVLTTF